MALEKSKLSKDSSNMRLSLPANQYLQNFAKVVEVTNDADALDVKQIETDLSLREFAVGFLSYQPAWVSFLYRVRGTIAPLFGLQAHGAPQANGLPEPKST